MFFRRRATVLSAAALVALMGCQSADDQNGDAAPDEAPTEEDDAVDEPDEDAAEDDDPADDEDDVNGGDGAATASWMGEDHTFSRVVCDEIVDDLFQIRASGADLPNLQVRFPPDGDGHDFDAPDLVEIFFDGEGGTIGDGEGYRARGEDIDGVTSDGTQVSGELELEPDDATRASEVHPDGGVLTFEMICP